MAGLRDAGLAAGLDLAGPGDAEPVAGAAAGGELPCLEPVVDDACAAAQPVGGLGDAEFAGDVGAGCWDLVGVADPLNGGDGERLAVAGGHARGVWGVRPGRGAGGLARAAGPH